MIAVRHQVAVINDDPAQLTLIKRILESDGLGVVTFLDPVEALRRLPELDALELIVLDLNMPRVDGWKACRTIRSPDYPVADDVPILIVSATFQGPGFEEITRSRGASGFLASPFSQEELIGKARALMSNPEAAPGELVLIVEDDPAVQRSVNKAFTVAGFRTHTASTIEEGWRASQELSPTTYVLDRSLPDGRIETFLTRLMAEPRSDGANPVVLIMTGDTDPGLPIKLLGLGADGFVRKPFAPELLVEAVRRATRERMLIDAEASFERTAAHLRGSEARFEALFDAVPDRVFAVDDRGRITAANSHASEGLTTAGDGLVGLSLVELLTTEDGRPFAPDTFDGAVEQRLEARLVLPHADPQPVEIVASARDEEAGSRVVVVVDISERLAHEEERERLTAQANHRQRLESLGVVAGGIAHDFNNLLLVLSNYLELAMGEVEPGGTASGYLERMQEATERATELAGQMLTFSGRGTRKVDRVDLTSLVPATTDLVSQTVSARGALITRFDGELPEIEGDATQISQVVMNLVLNAAEALDETGGTVTVETRVDELSGREPTAAYLEGTPRPGRFATLTVRDDGCGMDADTLGRIFDPFYTTKVDGRGLGLAMSLGIVRAHDGLVRVESEPGFGTEFTVLFPTERRVPRSRTVSVPEVRGRISVPSG